MALDAVLADIHRRGVDGIFDLGDVAQGSLDPGGAVGRLRDAGINSVRGNTDRMLLEAEPAPAFVADYEFARSSLSSADIRWLDGLPSLRRVEDLLLCHAAPGSDLVALLETVREQGVSLASDGEIVSRLGEVSGASVILVGHTHVPRVVRLADGRLCVNPGSVGLPAYRHHAPFPHAMEAGSPHARYAIIERDARGWGVEQIAVRYDWDRAAAQAAINGRLDRATWLRTGRAPG